MKKFKSLTGRFGLFRGVLTFLAISFGVSSCTPDFDLDKRFPEWLGTSIYETLSEGFDGHTFNYYVRLIDALDQRSILAKTGSRTLFVADDVAFQRFLDKCPIAGNKAVRFEDLSKAQLKMILKGSMLNNVFQVAALSSTSTENGVRIGDCMRRVSTMSEYDSVRVIMPDEMPNSSYWDYLRNNPNRQTKGAVVLEDGTKKPMIFFAPKFLESRKITDDDYNFLFNLGAYSGNTKPGRLADDASVNGVRIAIQNKKCFNGFIHVMEDVVYLLPSMAEYLAQLDADGNSETKIYSSIIERFSAPFYPSNSSTNAYPSDNDHTGSANSRKIRNLINDDYYGPMGSIISAALDANGLGINYDSAFTKLYFSARYQAASQDKDTLAVDPRRRAFEKSAVLKFDPGWNSYFISSSSDDDVALQEEMAVMFVPTDEAMMDWWLNDAQGQEMRERYGILASCPRNADSVAKDMSAIDLNVIVKLINNSMFASLSNTVPSKFKDLLNDAQDPFFTDPSSAVSHFKKVVMCCNGAIYFSDMIFPPTTYKAVSYPALVNEKLKIMNWAIEDSEMQFSYYLNSMATGYSLFLPEVNFTDKNEAKLRDKLVWVDPASFAFTDNKLGRENDTALIALAFYYDEDAKAVRADYYHYNAPTNTIWGSKINTTSITNLAFLRNRMEDFLDYHIILLNDKNYYAMEGGISSDDKGFAYYRTKGGGVVRFADNGFVANGDPNQDLSQLEVAGGWQVETGQSVKFLKRFDMTQVDGNGITYIIDKPIQTSRKSVFDVLSDTGTYTEFKEFFNLMNTSVNSEGQKLFTSDYGGLAIASTKCVSTFNTYNYTVYVPNNASIRKLIDDKVIFEPRQIAKWDSIYGNVWVKLTDKYYDNPAKYDAEWKDSVKLFYQTLYGVDIMTTDDSILLNYSTDYASNSTIDDDDLPYDIFKEKFINVKYDQVSNFLKYHIQDNSVYTNAEFNRGSAEYETAFMNFRKQFGKLKVSVGDDITITDENNNKRTVLKSYVGDRPYWNIMCREYVFKKYSSDYSSASSGDITDVPTTKLETSSYAVVHLIDGALCNGEVKF
jgi:hypothetical protein